MEASALPAPAALRRITVPAPLLRLRSDDQLVALFRGGCEDAFGVIHDRYRQRLLAYTRQMLAGSGHDPEDALQDVFIRAYGALRVNGRPVSLRAWLYRIAHNRCIDQLRRRDPAPADVFDLSRSPLSDPPAEVERREDLRRLVADVGRLPDQQRSALLMRELQGLSYDELAEALSVTVPSIKSLLVRARVGLVEAAEARDSACGEIRHDLLSAYDRGVRATGRARRHMRECRGCRDYRSELRSMTRRLHSLAPAAPAGPLGLLAKLGIGGSGAAAGSAGATGGGAIALGGSLTKVAALACCAALAAGGAYGVAHRSIGTGRGPDRAAGHWTRAQPSPRHLHQSTAAMPHASSRPAGAPSRAASAGDSGAALTRHGRARRHPDQFITGQDQSTAPDGPPLPAPAAGALAGTERQPGTGSADPVSATESDGSGRGDAVLPAGASSTSSPSAGTEPDARGRGTGKSPPGRSRSGSLPAQVASGASAGVLR